MKVMITWIMKDRMNTIVRRFKLEVVFNILVRIRFTKEWQNWQEKLVIWDFPWKNPFYIFIISILTNRNWLKISSKWSIKYKRRQKSIYGKQMNSDLTNPNQCVVFARMTSKTPSIKVIAIAISANYAG